MSNLINNNFQLKLVLKARVLAGVFFLTVLGSMFSVCSAGVDTGELVSKQEKKRSARLKKEARILMKEVIKGRVKEKREAKLKEKLEKKNILLGEEASSKEDILPVD